MMQFISDNYFYIVGILVICILLVKNFKSKVTLEKDGKVIDATRLMAVMSMGVKKDQTVTITVEGADEDAAYDALKSFFETNL